MQRLDAHMHFWDPVRGDYGWLTSDLPKLFRRFDHSDLKPELDAAHVDKALLIQAAPTAGETDYLLAIADKLSWICGVVGWVDLDSPEIEEEISIRAKHPKFVGVRPMLQDIDDIMWILRPPRVRGLEALARCRLVFDALIRPPHLTVMAQLAEAYPKLDIVIDHAAKPVIDRQPDPTWVSGMVRLSRYPNIACKISGLMTELVSLANPDWVVRHVRTLLDIFPGGNLIWGSDWPVVTTVSTYAEWLRLTQQCLAHLDVRTRDAIMGGNAARIYGLGS